MQALDLRISTHGDGDGGASAWRLQCASAGSPGGDNSTHLESCNHPAPAAILGDQGGGGGGMSALRLHRTSAGSLGGGGAESEPQPQFGKERGGAHQEGRGWPLIGAGEGRYGRKMDPAEGFPACQLAALRDSPREALCRRKRKRRRLTRGCGLARYGAHKRGWACARLYYVTKQGPERYSALLNAGQTQGRTTTRSTRASSPLFWRPWKAPGR